MWPILPDLKMKLYFSFIGVFANYVKTNDLYMLLKSHLK